MNLGINATLTIDFKLALAGLNETLTVTGEAPMIEVTQSKVANTIQTTELQNLPMLTRTISGMLELLPGAAPVGELHRTKQNVGTRIVRADRPAATSRPRWTARTTATTTTADR